MVTFTLFLFISYIGCIKSATEGEERIRMATSLFQVFDNHYYAALSNQDQCPLLKNQAAIFLSLTTPASSPSCEMMPENDIQENFICFCSTSPHYNLLEPTAEWIFSSSFVQYCAIQAIFTLTVGRIYNLYALEVPNTQLAEDCAKVASYLNAFRAIAFEDRMLEIEKIYEFAADDLLERTAEERLTEQENKGHSSFNMLSQQDNFFELDKLLDNLTNVIEIEGSSQVSNLLCNGNTSHRNTKGLGFPLQMDLDFYINANMDADKTPWHFGPIKTKYMLGKKKDFQFIWDKDYREYYYKEAWDDIFYISHLNFFPIANYFNYILYRDRPNLIHSGAFEPFTPPIDEALKVWGKAHQLRKIIDTEYNDNRSKVIKILREILMSNTPDDVIIKPKEIQITYKTPDISVDFKDN